MTKYHTLLSLDTTNYPYTITVSLRGNSRFIVFVGAIFGFCHRVMNDCFRFMHYDAKRYMMRIFGSFHFFSHLYVGETCFDFR